MVNLIVLQSRKVKVKGINNNDIIDNNKLNEYFFKEDYSNLKLLDNLPKFRRDGGLSLFYPGCGSDILFPLIYIDKLFPNIKEVKLIFLDRLNYLQTIKTILDDIGISFSEEGILKFYWKSKLISLYFVNGEVNSFLEEINGYDVYFEKAFRIMKSRYEGYEGLVYDKLNCGGVLISDSGFLGLDLEYLPIPRRLSSYGEMVLGVKKEK